MPPKRASPSVTPVPTTEGAVGDGSALPNDQWIGMQWLLDYIYDYRLEEYVEADRRLRTDGLMGHAILTVLQWLRPLKSLPPQRQQACCPWILRNDQGAHGT